MYSTDTGTGNSRERGGGNSGLCGATHHDESPPGATSPAARSAPCVASWNSDHAVSRSMASPADRPGQDKTPLSGMHRMAQDSAR